MIIILLTRETDLFMGILSPFYFEVLKFVWQIVDKLRKLSLELEENVDLKPCIILYYMKGVCLNQPPKQNLYLAIQILFWGIVSFITLTILRYSVGNTLRPPPHPVSLQLYKTRGIPPLGLNRSRPSQWIILYLICRLFAQQLTLSVHPSEPTSSLTSLHSYIRLILDRFRVCFED